MQCPANEAVCHKCGKMGHFRSMCRSRGNVQSVIATNSDEESFLGVVHSEMATVNETVDPWMTKIMLNGQEIEFKINTGADVTVIPESNHDTTRDGSLTPPGRSLSGPSQQTLDVLGQFSGRLKYRGKARHFCDTWAPESTSRVTSY